MLVNLYVRHTEVSRYVNNFHIEFSREKTDEFNFLLEYDENEHAFYELNGTYYIRKKLC